MSSDFQNDQSAVAGTAFVHLFEWRWTDIANECEQFLGPKGVEAVQVSPPNEHINHHTWWARYQPVSYQLESRSGTRGEFIDMVRRCNDAGVAIYADLVINHTAAFNGGGVGWAGTHWSYKNHPAFPAYSPGNYHATCQVNNYQDADNVQYCELVGLPDLDTAQWYVQDQIAGYINDLRSIGVAGFRIDAAKHIAPQDISGILAKASNPYVFLEVIGAAGEAVQPSWYTHIGQVTEFGYSPHIAHRFKHGQIRDLGNIADGKLPSDRAIVFTDNHDNQRGHGAGGEVLTYKDGSKYDIANAFMLAWPYGYPKVMSSYHFSDSDAGPPAGGGGCANSGFVCEHRWTTIANMFQFRNTTNGEGVSNWWDNGNNRIAFSRGNKGFISINNEGGTMSETLATGLPAGTYCNIAGGDFTGDACTGNTVSVDGNGRAHLQVAAYEALAIHIDARLSGSPGDPNPNPVDVYFTCHNGHTYWGQSVYVVGNIAKLGNWDVGRAVKLDPTSYPTWTGTISMPASTAVEWKCVKREEANPSQGVEWQSGPNNAFTTPSSGSTSATASF
ncbi:MAG: alpha amylase C-terminal domain-containing protein [Proteobacteria bacterium]|nr:alpha amylase C-terminal domain-containing protein [Pseudomonadota bacterium]